MGVCAKAAALALALAPFYGTPRVGSLQHPNGHSRAGPLGPLRAAHDDYELGFQAGYKRGTTGAPARKGFYG